MAKKITISVPDDLYEKMTVWKSSLNFSKVFQDAVSGMIRKKEVLTSRLREEIDFSAVVDRLKKEKIEFECNITECGKKDGLNGRNRPLPELQYALPE